MLLNAKEQKIQTRIAKVRLKMSATKSIEELLAIPANRKKYAEQIKFNELQRLSAIQRGEIMKKLIESMRNESK